MTDKQIWLEYRSRISMGIGLEGEQTKWVFDKALAGIELSESVKTLNETRRKRDEVKGKLEIALKEIKLRKQYESFLISVIRSGESLSEEHTFEWFCNHSK